MEHPPWYAEHRVDAQLAGALVRHHFGMRADAVLLGEGWRSVAYSIGDAVFRFPKRAEVVPHLRTELAVLPVLRDRLPLSIPEPRWVAEPAPDDDYPLPFAGYPRLPGVPLDQVPQRGPAVVLDQLLPFLDAVHATPVEGALASVEGWPLAVPAECSHPVAKRARTWLERHSLEPVPPVLLHGDLGVEHVL